jgi:multiple sugar transport system ATP-binding protein
MMNRRTAPIAKGRDSVASVVLRNLVKDFGETRVVHGMDLEIAHNEFVALVGPSGCGKSTTLRMIAGLEDASDGEILIDGRVVNELAPKDRDVAMVFQDYALYPHMTARENMAFGLEVRGLPRAEVDSRVAHAAAVLGITELLARKPRQLSGGQRQRVAMGRAIVRQPKVFLFDEPLSNLDAKLRVQMRTEIKKLHQRVATTVVYVTHDQVEAMTLADRIVVLRGGVIEQVGSPDDVYNHPASMFVAGFIGSPTMNFVPGRVARGGRSLALTSADPEISVDVPEQRVDACAAHDGRDVIVGIRPEHFSCATEVLPTHLTVPVDVVEPLGSDTLVFFRLGGSELVARIPPTVKVAPGAPIGLTIDAAQIHLFDAESERALQSVDRTAACLQEDSA